MLRLGSRGDRVRELQRALNAARPQGREPLVVDGIYGLLTRAADLFARGRTSSAVQSQTPTPPRPQPPQVIRAGATPFPSRPADALGGRRFLASIAGLSQTQREARIVAEILRGNVPFNRWHTVQVGGAPLRVLGDYLSVGSASDFVRVALTPRAVQRIATAIGAGLPTREEVDAIHAQATVHLTPETMNAEERALPYEVFTAVHNDRIAQQIAQHGWSEDALVDGAQKDMLASTRTDRVTIYGWFRPNGRPIQPLSTVHSANYVDYSHGARLVARS